MILLAACSQPEIEIPEHIAELENLTVYPADAEPSMTLNLEPVLSFGDTEEVMIGRLDGFVVDQTGRGFIADGSENTIHVYNSDGTYLQSLGREGEGPGEFGGIGYINIDSDFVYAMDWSQQKLNVFSIKDFTFSHTVNLSREGQDIEELKNAYPQQYYVRNDNTFLVEYSLPSMPDDDMDEERSNMFYKIDQEGKIVSDQVLTVRSPEFLYDNSSEGSIMMFSPFGRRPLVTAGKDDRIRTAWSEDFLIKFYDPEGSYEKAIYYPYQKAPIDRDALLSRYENDRMRRIVRNADAPDNWPALSTMLVDDENRLWVSAITDDDEIYDLWVLDDNGELLARLSWPRDKHIMRVTNGSLYSRETEEETGLSEVVQYKIELI